MGTLPNHSHLLSQAGPTAVELKPCWSGSSSVSACRRMPHQAWSERFQRVSASCYRGFLRVVCEGDLVIFTPVPLRLKLRRLGSGLGGFLGVIWEGDRLPTRSMTEVEPRYDHASTTRPTRRTDGDHVRIAPLATKWSPEWRTLSLANAAIPSAQRRMVELEIAETASRTHSTSSTPRPGTSTLVDPVTKPPRRRLQIDRRVHTCGDGGRRSRS